MWSDRSSPIRPTAGRRRGVLKSTTWSTPAELPGRYVPAAPLSLADAASQLGIRPVQLAQAIREGKVAVVHGRRGELAAHEELERVRREGSGRWSPLRTRRENPHVARLTGA
jgi:hypothetical protein